MAYMRSFVMKMNDVVLQLTGPSFDAHLEEIFGALIRGAQLVILKVGGQLDFDYITQTIYEKQVTYISPVPSWVNTLGKYLQENVDAQQRIKSLRCFCFGGKNTL